MWLKAWQKKQKELKKSLRDTHLYRIWGDRLWTSVVWRIDRRSIAGGLTLGVFIAFTPTIPFQMLLAVLGALYFRVNLPIALMACWITNPLTIIPIYGASWKLGRYIVHHIEIFRGTIDAYVVKGKPGLMIRQTIYIWIGSLIFASVAALFANILVRVFWKFVNKVKHIK
jgi:uncharacterized protein (DUF2062 family)